MKYSYFWMVRLLQFLNEPFPDSNSFSETIGGAVIAGTIVTGVLYLTQPLDIQDAPKGLLITSLSYGLITAVVVMAFQLVMIHIVKSDRESQSWTLWKWIGQTIIMVLCIALANILYGHFQFDMDLSLPTLLNIIVNTLQIGIVPVVVIGSLSVYRNKKKYTQLADGISPHVGHALSQLDKENISVKVQSGNQTLSLNPNTILFAKALQNYVQLYSIIDGQVSISTIRKTLSSLESELIDHSIVRCHRSYLVNKSKVISIKGNAQGLKLYFEGTDEFVSVSRKFVDVFRQN